jgi:hypothetical protein
MLLLLLLYATVCAALATFYGAIFVYESALIFELSSQPSPCLGAVLTDCSRDRV